MTDVDVPKVGPMNKKVVIGVAVGGAVYVLYRYHKASQAAAAAAAPADTPGYGDGTDGATLPIVPGAVSGVGVANGETTVNAPGTQPTTNAAWTQAAEQYLVTAGYSPDAVLKALGDYLAGLPLSSDEQAIVQAAIAVEGYPPTGNYHIITGGGDTPVGGVTGVHVTSVDDHDFTLNWYATAGASGYHVYEGDSLVATDHGTYHPFTNRKPATKYGPFTIAALNVAGHEGPRSTPIYASTQGTPGVFGGTSISGQTPQGLHVMQQTRSSVALGWYAIDGADTYLLYRNGRLISRDHGTYHVDNGLKSNSSYRYTLVATDAHGAKSKTSPAVTGHTTR